MKHKLWSILLLGALLAGLLGGCTGSGEAWAIWVDGKNLFRCEDYTLVCGGGTAVFDPDSNTLTLTDASVGRSHRGAAVYIRGDIRLVMAGACTLSGRRYGLRAEGEVSLFARGGAVLTGGDTAMKVRDAVWFEAGTGLTLLGGHQALEAGGWSADSQSTVLCGDSPDTAEAQFYADQPCLCLAEPCCLTYALNGGKGTDCAYVPADTCARPPADPTRAGYAFTGWYSDAACTEAYSFTEPVTEDLTLYAGWAELIEVWYDTWGGSAVPSGTSRKGEPVTPPEDPVREGYRFIGWYADESLETPYDFTQPAEESFVLFARWEKLADEVACGIDVSEHQGAIDWETAAAQVDFAFLRAGYRGYGESASLNEDACFADNLTGAVQAGVPLGAYFFSQAVSKAEAVAEAEYVLGLLDGAALTLPLVLDYEYASDDSGTAAGRLYEAALSPEEMAEICRAFLVTVEAAGYDGMVYASSAMLENGLGEALDRAGIPVWLASWTVQPRYTGAYSYWQYSETGQIAGIATAVDLDYHYIVY